MKIDQRREPWKMAYELRQQLFTEPCFRSLAAAPIFLDTNLGLNLV
jgi:hypothetical protein